MRSERYWWNRIIRHLVLASAATCICWIIYVVLPPPDVRHRWSMALAYASLFYLVLSLTIGPYRMWRKLANPTSFDLRRDIGIWAGLLAVLHTVVGLTVHSRGQMWRYFFQKLSPLQVHTSLFGLANYTGTIAFLIFLILLLISNDLALRTLGARWKSIQRWTYFGTGLTVIHGIAYQWVERRQMKWVTIFAAMTAVALGFQLAGFVSTRSKRSKAASRVKLKVS
jgi:sulfoxide reductase heme-binding subunit YedZ